MKAPRDVWFVETLLAQLEAKLRLGKRIGLEVLIEETEALARVEEIAASSPRLEALILGVGDLSASQGIRMGHVSDPALRYPGDMWHYARNRMIVAARANGIDAIDGPYPNYRDADGYRREATWGATLGCGRQVVHPPGPDRDRQRRLRADGEGDRAGAAHVRRLRGVAERRRRRRRRIRHARRRRLGAHLRGRPRAGAPYRPVVESVMAIENKALVLDLVEWIAAEPRPYDEVMDAWRTSCPRLPVWEDAVDAGFVVRTRPNEQQRYGHRDRCGASVPERRTRRRSLTYVPKILCASVPLWLRSQRSKLHAPFTE